MTNSLPARQPSRDALPFVAGAVIVALLAGVWLYRAYEEDRSGPRTALASAAPAGRDKDLPEVWVDGWVDDSRIARGGTIQFWISIRNHTGQKIEDISVLAFHSGHFDVPDNEFACWEPKATPERQFVPLCSDPLSQTRLRPALGPGDVDTIQGHLRARREPGPTSISAVIGWKDAAGVRHRVPVSIGPITIESDLATISKAVQTFFKDLGLPLVLVWLGYRVRKMEESREEGRKQADERTTRVRETWTQMLPKMHDNAEKYYMPLMGSAGYVSGYYPGKPDFCFYFYLRFLVKLREMVRKIGGFYLKSRIGEECVSALWDVIRECADARFGRQLRERGQDEVENIATVYAFQDQLATLPASTAMRAKFLDPVELDRFEAETALFDLFAIVLAYEANCSYEFWYGEPETFEEKAFKEARQKLERCRARLRAGKFEEIDKQLNRYVQSLEQRARSMQLGTFGSPA